VAVAVAAVLVLALVAVRLLFRRVVEELWLELDQTRDVEAVDADERLGVDTRARTLKDGRRRVNPP
jgi:hypothetical protein